jgi:hypothetical protein
MTMVQLNHGCDYIKYHMVKSPHNFDFHKMLTDFAFIACLPRTIHCS